MSNPTILRVSEKYRQFSKVHRYICSKFSGQFEAPEYEEMERGETERVRGRERGRKKKKKKRKREKKKKIKKRIKKKIKKEGEGGGREEERKEKEENLKVV